MRTLTSPPSITGIGRSNYVSQTTWQQNGTWTTNGNALSNTPTLGSELVTNGNMETGSPPSSWTATQVTLAADADVHGGSQALRVTSTEGTSDRAEQVVTLAVGNWVRLLGWGKRGSQGTQQVFNLGNTTAPVVAVATTSYAQYSTYGRVTTANPIVRLYANQNTGAVGDYGIYDDVSVKALTTNTLFAVTTGAADFNKVIARITQHDGVSVCGVVASLDSISSPANFVIALHDGVTTVSMFKCVAGTYTSLVSTSSVYAVGGQIEIRKTANTTYQLWYKGVQRGTDQTISDAGIKDNTLHGAFNVSSGNILTGVQVS